MSEIDVDIGSVVDASSSLDEVFELAQQLRVDSVRASTAAGSGHPTSSMSAADLMAVLQTRHLRYDWQNPDRPGNDHLVLHCGVEIGPDRPSQMGVEDIAMMRSIHGSTVLYPSDGPSAAALTAAMADIPGISYLRATRGDYPVLYGQGESFPIGGSKTHHAGDDDRLTLIGAGVTLHECLKARGELAADGIATRVVDLYSVKPLDTRTLARCAAQTSAFVVVEDHHPEGGMGEAVLGALSDLDVSVPVVRLAVTTLPGSGTPAECLDAAGISAPHIVQAARKLVGDSSSRR